MSSADPIAVLEIGTSNTVLAVGEALPNGRVRVANIESVASCAVRKSQILDLAQVSNLLVSLLRHLADNTDYSIGTANLLVSGTQIRTKVLSNQVAVDDGVVREEHLGDVNDAALAETLRSADHVALELEPIGYRLDDIDGIDSPRGMNGKLLTLRSLCVSGSRARIRDAQTAAFNAKLEVKDSQVYFAGTCAAAAVLTPRHKQNGALVIDLGGGTTSFTVWHAGHLVQAGVVGVGGDHVTSDIQSAFAITQRQAEQIKTTSAAALVRANDGAPRITVPDPMPGSKAATISRRALDTVVNARLQELFTVIRDKIDQENHLHSLNAGVFLTGGGALMPGIVELARTVFGCGAQLGSLIPEIEGMDALVPQRPAVAHAAHAGLLYLVQLENRQKPGAFESLSHFFKGLFRK